MTLPMCFMILYEMVPVFLTRKKVNESFPIIPVHYKANLREFWGKPLSTSAGLPFKSKQLNCAKNQSLYVYLLKISLSVYDRHWVKFHSSRKQDYHHICHHQIHMLYMGMHDQYYSRPNLNRSEILLNVNTWPTLVGFFGWIT